MFQGHFGKRVERLTSNFKSKMSNWIKIRCITSKRIKIKNITSKVYKEKKKLTWILKSQERRGEGRKQV